MTEIPKLPPPPTVKLNIEIEVGLHPKDRVLATEYFVKALCKAAKLDPAEAVMMLMTAAVHISLAYSKEPMNVVLPNMGTALGAAAGAAVKWWPPKDFKKLILHS